MRHGLGIRPLGAANSSCPYRRQPWRRYRAAARAAVGAAQRSEEIGVSKNGVAESHKDRPDTRRRSSHLDASSQGQQIRALLTKFPKSLQVMATRGFSCPLPSSQTLFQNDLQPCTGLEPPAELARATASCAGMPLLGRLIAQSRHSLINFQHMNSCGVLLNYSHPLHAALDSLVAGRGPARRPQGRKSAHLPARQSARLLWRHRPHSRHDPRSTCMNLWT